MSVSPTRIVIHGYVVQSWRGRDGRALVRLMDLERGCFVAFDPADRDAIAKAIRDVGDRLVEAQK